MKGSKTMESSCRIGQKASGMSKKFWSMQKRRLESAGLIWPVHGGAQGAFSCEMQK
jgi:hypothetical protein